MKFTVICRNKGASLANTWEEHYSLGEIETAEQAIAWAQQTLASFNANLRGSAPRELVGVRMGAGNGVLKHKWRKTNLVTIMNPSGPSYDTARCEVCSATARRYGLSGNHSLDKRFKEYIDCPGEMI